VSAKRPKYPLSAALVPHRLGTTNTRFLIDGICYAHLRSRSLRPASHLWAEVPVERSGFWSGELASDSLRRICMKELALPVRHDWLVRERPYGKIVIEPFEPG